ncbi:hypothetical protein B0H13DRAFT_1631527 [Mycena leptocephala]|nr:hypothetical protein B0H13DRAFT_1631527 [Mycena leptocephala]
MLYRAVQPGQIPTPNFSFGPSVSAVNWLWEDIDAPPDANATGHLIFDTVNSFLQHWPNTRYRNGHSIVPSTIPVGTLIYHTGADKSLPTLPTIPEWAATDPEHSFLFCWGPNVENTSTTSCWQLKLATTRLLTVLYFDGSSAAKVAEDGTLDVQDLLIWGKVDPARSRDDRARIDDLCAWGSELGIDGFVRMEMDFEIMLCDFAQSVELLSADYLPAWRGSLPKPSTAANSTLEAPRPSSSHKPPWKETFQHAAQLLHFETVRAGSWHNRYPGETRISLDLTRFISFYDTALAPSLVPARAEKERWDHRVQEISAEDLTTAKTRLQEVLKSTVKNPVSGIDWQTLYRVVMDRYADRLEMLEYLLNTTDAANLNDRARIIQVQLRVMLTPYIVYADRPTSGAAVDEVVDQAWSRPVWHRCATTHTAHIHASAALQSRLTASERLLLRAVDETNREICRILVRLWAAGVHGGLDPLIATEKNATTFEISSIVEGWRADAQALMGWLDWSVWVKCRPACPFEEICYLPTWPFFWHKASDPDWRNGPWKRPQPRCIRQFEPYSVL